MRIHKYCYKNYQKIRQYFYYTGFVLIVLAFIYALTNWKFIDCIMTIDSLLCIALFVMHKINSVLISLKKFLLYGSFCGLILMYMLSTILFDVFKTYDNNTDTVIELIIMYICLLISWSVLSYIANNKVAKMVNIIFATIISLTAYIKDIILDFLPDNLFQKYNITPLLQMYGYTPKQLFEIMLDIILMPVLIINVLTALVCEIKGYWIEKYNDGKDITMEEIMKEE